MYNKREKEWEFYIFFLTSPLCYLRSIISARGWIWQRTVPEEDAWRKIPEESRHLQLKHVPILYFQFKNFHSARDSKSRHGDQTKLRQSQTRKSGNKSPHKSLIVTESLQTKWKIVMYSTLTSCRRGNEQMGEGEENEARRSLCSISKEPELFTWTSQHKRRRRQSLDSFV